MATFETGYVRITMNRPMKDLLSGNTRVKYGRIKNEVYHDIARHVVRKCKACCPRPGWPLPWYSSYTPTGRLRLSIRSRTFTKKVSKAERSRRAMRGKVVIYAGGKYGVDYARYVHEGTVYMPPRPFLNRGVQQSHNYIKKQLHSIFERCFK